MNYRLNHSFLAIITLLAVAATSAQKLAAQTRIKDSPGNKVGLVLEGGGALGFAHVGALKVLEEERVPVHMIAGTSMGSIVGAAYASGRTVKELEEVLSTTDWDMLFNETVPREKLGYRLKPGRDGEIYGDTKIGISDNGIITATAMVEGQKIEPLFQKLFGKVPATTSFDDLPIPFRAVAADIETGDAVVIDHGSLAMAARASMSVPGFFSPVESEGRMLVDGGITNNFPVDVALKMHPDVLVGVEFNFDPLKRDQLTGPLAISGQILNLLLERTSASGRALMRPGDIMIHPNVNGYTSTSFGGAKEIMKAGEDAARALAPQLRKYSVSEEEYAKYQAKRTAGTQYAPTIDYIRVEGVSPSRETAILKTLSVEVGKPLSTAVLEREIEDVHDTGEYRKVSYEIEEKDGKTGLVIDAKEKEWYKQYVRLGFGIEDNFKGQSSYTLGAEARFNDLNSYGGYLITQVNLGESPKVLAEFYQPIAEGSPFFIAPEIAWYRTNIDVLKGDDIVAEYQREAAVIELKGGFELGKYGEFASGWRRGPGKLDRLIGEQTLPNFHYQIGEMFARLDLDQYDNPDFPTKGFRANLTGTASRQGTGSDEDFEQSRGFLGKPFTFGANTLLIAGEGGVSSADLPVERAYALGGFLNVSGFPQNSLIADDYWTSRTLLYHRFAKGSSSLLNFGGYYGGSVEYASIKNNIEAVGDYPSIVAGSVFVGIDTPLVPIYLGFGINNQSENSLYFAVGRLNVRNGM